ncbi:uncharacterized protein [Musca autumnalis]|uniref:uncharacterized protein n=1 Tax=Musca autumnalis TaxID=221902 RepID=UPI003CF0789D
MCRRISHHHNTLLHKGSDTEDPLTTPSSSTSNYRNSGSSSTTTQFAPRNSTPLQSTSNPNGIVQSCFATNSKGVLLGTALVKILHCDVSYTARALIDSGAEGTFISEKLFNFLKLPSTRAAAKVSGLNNTVSANVQKECHFTMGSHSNDNFQMTISALVVPHLSNNLPSSTISIDIMPNFRELEVADSKFYESSKIDILLGADLLPSIMLPGYKNGICGSLMAQETVFGWILTGPVPNQTVSTFSTCVSYFSEISADNEISRFWEVENIPSRNAMSRSDTFCEDLYERSTTRDDEGRYVVSLPFKEEYPQTSSLGYSRNSAMAQFFRNERRLLRDPQLKRQYDENIQEYILLRHMTPIQVNDPLHTASCFYLPHHAVIKPDSTTTKVRVVFNASYPSSNGLSLNDILYTGPVLQNDLTILIHNWRFYRYVFNGDIQKMYRQIRVNSAHTPFQRILFRKSPNDPLQDFELKTVTFGVNCAPYLAIRTMMQLAQDVKETFPFGIQNFTVFYVRRRCARRGT